jgi:hypothetical protein
MPPRARWAVACAVAAVVPLAVPHGVENWVGPGVFGLALGVAEAIALGGPRRVRWLALTALGVWLSFPFGYIAGLAAFLAVALPLTFAGLHGDGPASVGLVAALVVGGGAAGALVGALQASLVSAAGAWIWRSARAGVFMLPAAAVALFAPTTASATEMPTLAVLFVSALVGGAVCGLITGGGIARPAVAAAP